MTQVMADATPCEWARSLRPKLQAAIDAQIACMEKPDRMGDLQHGAAGKLEQLQALMKWTFEICNLSEPLVLYSSPGGQCDWRYY